MKNLIARLIREEAGQDLIEYAFIAVFIALVVLAGLQSVGTGINTKLGEINTQITTGS